MPCRVPVPCLRRAYAGGRATRAHPPPLAPTSRTHQGQRRGQRGDGEGRTARTPPPPASYSDAHPQKGRGRREKKKIKIKKKKTQSEQPRTPTCRSRDRQQGQTGQGGSQGAQQGARAPGDESRGAGTNGGGRGDEGPRTTLVRYQTSGVWGPPRCPYRPHLSASNKVGYARDRWPAARGGTGLGGWPMGLTRSTPHGTYCGSCPVRGCG